QRGLAAAGRPQQHQPLAARELERDVVDGDVLPAAVVAVGEPEAGGLDQRRRRDRGRIPPHSWFERPGAGIRSPSLPPPLRGRETISYRSTLASPTRRVTRCASRCSSRARTGRRLAPIRSRSVATVTEPCGATISLTSATA